MNEFHWTGYDLIAILQIYLNYLSHAMGQQGDTDWKNSPPYQPRSAEDFGTVHWRGNCQCQRVVYELNRMQPLGAKFCHCHGCQVLHGEQFNCGWLPLRRFTWVLIRGRLYGVGAPFQWAAIFEKSDMRFIKGHDNLTFYETAGESQDHVLPCKLSCSFCHSPIMDEGKRMLLLFPELIRFTDGDDGIEERKLFAPRFVYIWWPISWYPSNRS